MAASYTLNVDQGAQLQRRVVYRSPTAVAPTKDKGGWNANTNSPALASSVGTKGSFYKVTTAGATSLNGITSWLVGDWAVYNGASWEKASPINLTGYTAEWYLKLTGLAELIANSTNGFCTIEAPPTNGAILLDVPDETTDLWTMEEGAHYLMLIPPDGKLNRLLQGSIKVSVKYG